MTDIGKIIAGIDCCMPDLNTFERNCENCPYVDDGDCIEMMLADMRKLLEEQPDVVRCKDCKYSEPYNDYGEINGIVCYGCWHKDDWFCADGER